MAGRQGELPPFGSRQPREWPAVVSSSFFFSLFLFLRVLLLIPTNDLQQIKQIRKCQLKPPRPPML